MCVPLYVQLYSFFCDLYISIESDESEDDTLCPCGRRNENMIGCDSKTCAIKWYHFSCAGISETDIPKGLWYCNSCSKRYLMDKPHDG